MSSLVKRYRRNISAARDIAPKRRHGVSHSTGGLGMRPPGSGAVKYPGRDDMRRVRVTTDVDAVTAALADGGT